MVQEHAEPTMHILANKEGLNGVICLALAMMHFKQRHRIEVRLATEKFKKQKGGPVNEAETRLDELIKEGLEDKTLLVLGLSPSPRFFELMEKAAKTTGEDRREVIWIDNNPMLCGSAEYLEKKGITLGVTHLKFCTAALFEKFYFKSEDITASLLTSLAQINTYPECRIIQVPGYQEGDLMALSQRLWELINKKNEDENKGNDEKEGEICELSFLSLAACLAQDKEFWLREEDMQFCGFFLGDGQGDFLSGKPSAPTASLPDFGTRGRRVRR